MLNSHYVITFGLTENNNILIKNHLKTIKCEVIEANSYMDLITSDYFLSIINHKMLDDRALKKLIEYYTEVDGNLTERIIIASEQDALSKESHAQVFRCFDDLEAGIDPVLHKAYKKAKKEENKINNLLYALNTLSQIREHPGITTDQLSQKVNRNSLTVKRYIEVLRVMGEKIKYNPQTKGWEINEEK